MPLLHHHAADHRSIVDDREPAVVMAVYVVVDEFLHVWEQHLRLTDVVSWLRGEGMQVQRMTDYYDQEIPLDVTYHSSSPVLAEKVGKLPFESQCHVIDMIVRPYWISLFAQKSSG